MGENLSEFAAFVEKTRQDHNIPGVAAAIVQGSETIFAEGFGVRDIRGYAYPIMTLGAYQRLSRLHEITEGSLLLAGDYMIYPTFESAAESGYLAARKAKNELA